MLTYINRYINIFGVTIKSLLIELKELIARNLA